MSCESIYKDIKLNSEKDMLLGSGWTNTLGRVELEAVIKDLLPVESQANALRYYEGAVQASSVAEQLTAVRLLNETLRSTPGSNSAAQQLQGKLTRYHQRLSNTAGLLSTGKPVPRKLHFVWVGGGIGAIQRDYINVWKQVTAPDGYPLNLWYDSDGLLAHETNRIIVESAKALGERSSPDLAQERALTLGNRYVERARELRRQMFEHIQKAVAAGESADQARINLLVSAYGQDEAALTALKARNLQSFEGLQANGIALRDIRAELSDQPLFDIYEKELSFRGNLAAASDITRLQALNIESGTYLDTDLLPSLHEKIGGVDLANLDIETRMGVMQILLDHNRQILPNRGAEYADFRHRVAESLKSGLIEFAKEATSITDIFAPFNDVLVAEHGLRVGNKNTAGINLTPFNGLSNAMLSGHAGSAALAGVFDKIRGNYAFLDRIVRLAQKEQISLADHTALPDLILREMEKTYGPLFGWNNELAARQGFLQALANYDSDGIKFDAQSAIVMSGPSAVSQGLNDFVNEHLITAARQQISDRVDLRDGFNLATEEETHHSWKDNAKTEQDWLELETTRLKDGVYKNHYRGNVDELLKGQTLTFKRGWPVIEDRPVLLTSVLQQLLDELGEPFIRAMNDRLTGDIRFDKALSIDFETRQQILKQPVSELPPSTGAESLGNLNEALARISAGKLPSDQLSPLHRVMFGGLFGAATLDQAGFADAWATTVAFAEDTRDRGLTARYEVIEQTLLSRDPAPVVARNNASKHESSGQNSRVLKAQAFAEPISVRQWREYVSRVEVAAMHERRASILARGAAVREAFFEAGAHTARQLPQDLLVRGAGDPGRRCYPLALVMAAALEKGAAAERALIGKLAIANLTPDAPQAHALLKVLDELRGVPMARFGEKQPAANLAAVMQALDMKTGAGSLLLNTDNHSMLVSKVVAQGETSYRFYDPNFGLYAFARIEELQQGVQRFMQDEVIARLYGLEQASDSVFAVIELDGASIAGKSLPSDIRVEHLLSSDPLSGGRAVEPWSQHAALRARSLSENARLGQALSTVDSHKWARTIESATLRLQDQHQLSRDFVPVFESLKNTTQGRSEITLVSARDPQRTRTVQTDDTRLSGIKSYLSDTFEALSGRRAGSPLIDPTDVGAVHTLNAGFAIQALLLGLQNAESAAGSTALTSAVRVHGYLAYAQMAHGLVVDAVQLLNLVRHAFTDGLRVARTTSSIVSQALGNVLNEGVGSVLQLASIGFDIYLLVNAQNDSQRAAHATQLAFDSAGLALGVGALGAGLAGAGTAAAFLGGASVILGGLAVGIGALVEGFSARADRGRRIGRYLNDVHAAYRPKSHVVKGDTYIANPCAVYTGLDLRKGLITFGDHKIFAAEDYHFLQKPRIVGDRSKAFSIREALDLRDSISFDTAPGIESVVLPSVPECFLGFAHEGLPFATTLREDMETALALEKYKREGKQQFWFSFYQAPTEYIMEKMLPNYVETRVSVAIGPEQRFLHVPPLPQEVHGYLGYDIDAAGGHCSITLAEGVKSLRLQVSTDHAMSWSLRAPWVSAATVRLEQDTVELGTTRVQVPARSVVFLQLEDGFYQVGWATGTLLLAELDAVDDADGASTRKQLHELARTHRLADGLTVIRNYHDALTGVRTTAWYDYTEDALHLVRGLDPQYAAQICIGPEIGEERFYYCPVQGIIWRTDLVTGQIKRMYRVMKVASENNSCIVSMQASPEGLQVVQRVDTWLDDVYKLTYLIGEDQLLLTAISDINLNSPFVIREGRGTVGDFLGHYNYRYNDALDDQSVKFTLGAMLAIDTFDHNLRKATRTWVRSEDERFIRPLLSNVEDTADLLDCVLLDPHQTSGDTVLFHHLGHRHIYQHHITAADQASESFAQKVLPLNVQHVQRQAGQYVILTDEGMLFQLSADGQTRLIGLTHTWLPAWRQRNTLSRAGWWEPVAVNIENWSADGVEVGGISDVTGQTPLYVVYLDQRFLIADTAGKAMRVLRLTPDKKAAWMMDWATGRIYRQPFMAPESLAAAFGSGTRLLQADLLAPMQRVMPRDTFAWAVPYGEGLHVRRHDHVLFNLVDGELPRIVGVEVEFFNGLESRQAREEKLARLLAGQRSGPYLFAGRSDNLCSWYDVAAGRLLSVSVSGRERPQYLGVANDQTLVLHDPVTGRLFSNASEDINPSIHG